MTEPFLILSLRPVASHLQAIDGREILFTRAVLTISNSGDTDVTGLVPHVTLGQEGGTVQDVTHALAGSAVALPPGGSITWDVYDLLLPAHPGTASKVHMFGYRAVLNWKFDLAAWADFRLTGSSGPLQTPITRWTLQWSVPDPSTGAVALSIQEGSG
jgi:hypothetical protein